MMADRGADQLKFEVQGHIAGGGLLILRTETRHAVDEQGEEGLGRRCCESKRMSKTKRWTGSTGMGAVEIGTTERTRDASAGAGSTSTDIDLKSSRHATKQNV